MTEMDKLNAVNVSKAIALLNQAREWLEQTDGEPDLQDAAEEIGPILLIVEGWQTTRSE